MKRKLSAAAAAIALAGGLTVVTALPSQAAGCTFDVIASSTTQTVARNVSCVAIQSTIDYLSNSGVKYTKKGDKVTGKYSVSSVTAPTSMTVGHHVITWY